MEHSAASPSRAVSPRSSSSSSSNNNNNNNNSNSPPREKKRKLESFVTESGETWEFTRPVKKPRLSGPGSNTSTSLGSIPLFAPSSPTRSKRSRDPSDDADAQSPSPKRQMTSVTDLGDHAAVLRRNSWLSSSRKRRGAAASRSRSPSQGGLLGSFDAGFGASQSAGTVESEELPELLDYESDEVEEKEIELPDYESDEEVTVGQHAVNNLEQVASFQVPALTLPPAGLFQEGQESEMPVVASTETDQDTKYQVGSGYHRAFETVVSGEYAVVAGNGTYEATSTTRPVVWTRLDPRLASVSRSPSPVTRYKLARADSSGSESEGDSPRLLRSKFVGFTPAAATVQHRSEAQQQLARKPGNTSTSSEVREVHGMAPPSSPAKELSPAVARSPTTTPAALQPTIMDEPSQQLLSELQRYADENDSSQQLLSELDDNANDSRDLSGSQAQEQDQEKEEVKSQESLESEADVCAPTTSDAGQRAPNPPTNASPLQQINSAPTPQTFTYVEEEIQHMMAVRVGEDDSEGWRIWLGELRGDCMAVDGGNNPDLFESTQETPRERQRRKRDALINRTKEIRDARQHFEKRQKCLDEAPDAETAPEIDSDDPSEDNDEYTIHLVASSTDQLQAEKARLQAEWERYSSPRPDPSTLPSGHWGQEARTCAANQANASNLAEKHYWSSRNIQAEAFANGAPDPISTVWISLQLIDWNRSIAASEEDAAAFAEQVSQINLGQDEQEDQEAPLREKLALFLEELPPDLDQKVSEILNISNPGRAIVKSPEGNDLTRKDFATLLHSANYRTGEPEGWLNDEIINGFFTALCNAMNDKAGHTKGKVPPFASYITGWYSSVTKKGMDAIKRWSRRKGIMGDKLLQCKRIFFPVNPGNHWSLLVICPDNHTIEYLDSLDVGHSADNRKSARYIRLGRQWLQMELGDKYVEEEWTDVDRRSAIQNNGSDCGVFTCLNGFVSALALSSPNKEFGPEQIPYARRAMVSMFNFGGFNKHFEL